MEYEADTPMRLIEIVYRVTYDERQRKREFQEHCECSSQSHVGPERKCYFHQGGGYTVYSAIMGMATELLPG